ncbi:MAG TPA: hypothetical protein VL095_10300, partial [Flavisolibacter sp.]|nr:hypothetical protein [Flavisolibacter sp.]
IVERQFKKVLNCCIPTKDDKAEFTIDDSSSRYKTKIMKLVLLLILLCGITPTSNHTAKTKKSHIAHQTSSNFDMVPSGLLFQF